MGAGVCRENRFCVSACASTVIRYDVGMRRFARRVLNALIVVSLLLCAVTSAQWAVSSTHWRGLYLPLGGGNLCSLYCSPDGVLYSHFHGWPPPASIRYCAGKLPLAPSVDFDRLKDIVFATNGFGGSRTHEWTWWRFRGQVGVICVVTHNDGSVNWDAPVLATLKNLATQHYSPPMQYWSIVIAYPLLITLFAMFPAAVLLKFSATRLRRHFRKKSGHCPSCDYDLTANISGVCPECGTTVARSGT